MIAELILTAIIGAIIGWLIYHFKQMYDIKKMMTNIPEKIKKQDKVFYADGKKLSFFEEEIKEATNTVEKSIDKEKNKKLREQVKKIKPTKNDIKRSHPKRTRIKK